MRGLAFPTTAVYEREESCDYGTPFSGGGDIPIDPALTTPIDPALMEDGQSMLVAQVSVRTAICLSLLDAGGPKRRVAKRSNESRIHLFLLY